MRQSQKLTAPQLDFIGNLLEKWSRTHSGGLAGFMRFLETPSAERSMFFEDMRPEIKIYSGILIHTFR